MVRKISGSYTSAVYVYYKTGRIVGVNGTSNQAVIQQFSRISPGVDLNFQRPGLYFKTGPSFVG